MEPVSDRFKSEEISKYYAKYRAQHSPEFYAFIVKYLRQKLSAGNKSLAIDVACGTGSSTRPLAEYFDKVIGTDISDSQIAEAIKDPQNAKNIHYQVGSFDKIPAEDSSVDLVAVSEASHWFLPIEDFYKEVHRVLKPGGCVAIYEYGKSTFMDLPDSKKMDELYHNSKYDPRLDPYHVTQTTRQKGLVNINLPYEESFRNTEFEIHRYITLEHFLGDMRSRSVYHAYYAANPGPSGPIEDFHEKLKPYLSDHPASEINLHVRYNVWLVMGRKPLQ